MVRLPVLKVNGPLGMILYATFPSINRLCPAEQQRLQEQLGRIADTPLDTAQLS
jgi:hypothetical protein